jgi:hypothetical protein
MRFELTIRALEEIGAYEASLASLQGLKIDIADHDRVSDPVLSAGWVHERFPKADISVCVSARHCAESGGDTGRVIFRKRISDIKKLGIHRMMVVSGYPRGAFDSLDALHTMYDLRLTEGLAVACAYNPFYDPGRLREEQDRLRTKLGFPFVKEVGLQIGMDIGKVQKAVEFIRSIRTDVVISGCVPAPANDTLQLLKTSPFYGVFLPNSYLLNAEIAQEMTRELLRAFAKERIEPIIYTASPEDIVRTRDAFVA